MQSHTVYIMVNDSLWTTLCLLISHARLMLALFDTVNTLSHKGEVQLHSMLPW